MEHTPSAFLTVLRRMFDKLSVERMALLHHVEFLDRLGDQYAVRTVLQAPALMDAIDGLDKAQKALTEHIAGLMKVTE